MITLSKILLYLMLNTLLYINALNYSYSLVGDFGDPFSFISVWCIHSTTSGHLNRVSDQGFISSLIPKASKIQLSHTTQGEIRSNPGSECQLLNQVLSYNHYLNSPIPPLAQKPDVEGALSSGSKVLKEPDISFAYCFKGNMTEKKLLYTNHKIMKFKKPNRIHETNIQAEFYHQCKLHNINCYLEYRVDNCQFDVIIIRGDEIKYIVEIKSYKTNRPMKTDTKQLKKYRRYNVPILCISRMSQIKEVIKSFA